MMKQLESSVVLFAACIPEMLFRISVGILNILMGLFWFCLESAPNPVCTN